ncbi:sulfatase family protein [Horticoccus sp. 23ND18S-11]|uniref:sulfatase family protein n=1 Tax=Horticoccus sp. 23ND18S-11 TaxID=3391832 RepID=UPI0039C9DDE9
MRIRFPLILCASVAWAAAASAADSRRPNILLALADNWGWPHAGVLGDPLAQTPVFDRVAREGMLFANTFCPVPSCSPTRASLLTGRAAHQLADAASLWSKFDRAYPVFTDMLRAGGYDVGFTGKGWSPGNFKDFGWTDNPVGREYNDFAGFLAAKDASKPFFFWLGNIDTARHKWRYDAEGLAGLDPAKLVVPPQFPDDPATRSSLLAYYGGVRRMDQAIGEALAELERRGELDNTIVIYTSDNGWQFPRGLANCYDTGTRVPLAIRWPGRVKASGKLQGFVSLTDLAPTFLEIAGVPVPRAMTGRSFAGLLQGRAESTPRDAVFLERERHANVRRGDLSYPVRGIRTGEFLYLWNLRPDRWPAGDPELYHSVGPFGDVDLSPLKELLVNGAGRPELARFRTLALERRPAEELYDLRSDPHQLRNVAADAAYAAPKQQLRARVDQWMRDTADPRVDPAYDGWDKFPYFGPPIRPAGEKAKQPRKTAQEKTSGPSAPAVTR